MTIDDKSPKTEIPPSEADNISSKAPGISQEEKSQPPEAKSESPKAQSPSPVAASEAGTVPPPEQSKPRRTLARLAIPIFVLLLAAAILFLINANWNSWVGRSGSQKTDDAYLRADITPLSTRVSGTVMTVAVEDYQKVKAGDLLVQIKDDDYRAQVEQSEAAVQAADAALENNGKQKALQEVRIAQAQAGVEAAKAEIAQAEANIEAMRAEIANTKANVEAAKADAVRTQLERERQEALVASASATRQKLEQATADEERFGAVLESRKADLST